MILFIGSAVLFLAFTQSTKRQPIADYYDRQLDHLLLSGRKLEKSVSANLPKDSLIKRFLECRNAYKSIEFFVDAFDPLRAKLLNGVDLLRIEEDAATDSLKPHGLQTIEAILYAENFDKKRFTNEITVLIKNTEQLRKDPERAFYFKDEAVWEAMRQGIFRIISLGITGFDAPISHHSLPETRVVLSSIHNTISFYKTGIPDTFLQRGNLLFARADNYLQLHNNFNTFDRLVFIREHVNKISAWVTVCRKQLGYVNYNQATPLSPDAQHLFAYDIMSLPFFSYNERYRPTAERIALGNRLFYDTRMSGTNTRSCASCHQPEKGFADGLQQPMDLSGKKILPRNTPTLWNAIYQKAQFYDSRSETLEDQLGEVLHNTNEMNSSLHDQVKNLALDSQYYRLFREAYPGGEAPLNEFNIANAIANYVRSLISMNSRFDRYMRHETDSFTASEKNGFNLFMGKASCGTCHYAPVFNGLVPPQYEETESEILAVPATNKQKSTLDTDPGRGGFTKISLHKHAFKTPSIRNIALTAPYMHNGVFKTLDEVIDFYNDGGGAGRGISLETQTLPTDKLHLTKKEMKDIVAFLHTLTDAVTVAQK